MVNSNISNGTKPQILCSFVKHIARSPQTILEVHLKNDLFVNVLKNVIYN